MIQVLEEVLQQVVSGAVLLFEFMGVVVIILSGLQGMIGYIRRSPLTRLKLAKGMALGLEFKLGSEILRTVVVRSTEEIYLVGCIILLRAALTFLIHWEIKNAQASHESIEPPEKLRWPWKKRKLQRKKESHRNEHAE